MNILASLLVSLTVLLALVASSATAQSSTGCTICEFAINYVEGFLQQNYTETQIIDQLKALCDLALPGDFKLQCEIVVTIYVPALISALVNDVSPQEACTVVGLCSSSAAAAAAPVLTTKTHTKPMTLVKVN